MNLEQLVNDYVELQKQEAELKEKKESLKLDIMEAMQDNKVSKYLTDDGITAQLQYKVTFKYTNEKELISKLEEDGLGAFIMKAVNTKAFNSALKASDELLSDDKYGKYIEQQLTTALVVK